MTTQSASAVTVDLDELEALAKAAAEGITSADWFTVHHFLCEKYEEQDAAFIAALNPTVALALLQELRAHRALLLAIHDLASARLNGANKLSPWEYWEHDMREIERLSSET